MENITLNVEGMSCGSCVNSIEGSVGQLDGVESVKVHFQDGRVDVSFHTDKVKLKDITDVIEEQGYNVA
ncbi:MULTISPECIES: copper chaperone CopZ [Oceanobacillus]|uniref:copper chaperone CopZ n=1 Tax=Oceanobacillus TaxID=182709 RepID=UPI000595C072|nr:MULTISPECIES: copper chaperone CopZ [Oceanobacillus]